MKTLLLVTLLILVSCSSMVEEVEPYPFIPQKPLSSSNYKKHLERLAQIYLENNKTQYVTSKYNSRYFQTLAKRLIKNNENFLVPVNRVNVYIIKKEIPLYFSTPGMNIFLTSGLIKKYLKNEELFVSLFTTEFVKSNLGLYKKINIVPFNNITIRDLLRVSKLDLDEKKRINNITYEILKRSGFDPESKLLWLQIQNRNSIEFTQQYENPNEISKEEFFLKNYMVSQKNRSGIKYEKNSSRGFYRFKKYVERIHE